jgi:hypothetical protein
MIHKRMTSRHLSVILVLLALMLIAPAAAQGTAVRVVQPGETIEVGDEALVLDLSPLRNTTTYNPVTELRQYRDDDPAKQIVRVIGVPKDDYVTINTHTLDGRYGRYFAFSSKDGLIRQHSIIFAPAVAATTTGAAETPATATEAATETAGETGTAPGTATAAPTQAPLSGLIAIAAIGICGLLAGTGRR